MAFSNIKLQEHFDRNLNSIPSCDREYPDCLISTKDVLLAHYHIVDYFLDIKTNNENNVGGIGIKDINMLCSAVSRQIWCSNPKDLYEACATVLFGIIKNHPFFDCNKRTAILTIFFILLKNGKMPATEHSRFEKLTINIATDNLSNYQRYKNLLKKKNGKLLVIAKFLRQETRSIEYDKPRITFRELRKILARQGFELSNTLKGYATINKIEHNRTGIFKHKITEKKTKLCRVGCQGDNREVDTGTLNRIRQKTGLTQLDGFDSASFYRGETSLAELIQDYSEMLKRLADK